MPAVNVTVLVHITLKAFKLTGLMTSDYYEFKLHIKGVILSMQESFG